MAREVAGGEESPLSLEMSPSRESDIVESYSHWFLSWGSR